MSVTAREQPHDSAVIALPEQVDCAAIQALARQADGARLAGQRVIVIDLRAISFIDTPPSASFAPSCGAFPAALRDARSSALTHACNGSWSCVRSTGSSFTAASEPRGAAAPLRRPYWPASPGAGCSRETHRHDHPPRPRELRRGEAR